MSVFPLSRRGNAVRFFHFVFLCLARRLLLFFAVLLSLGSLFEKCSGANFCFWVSVLVLGFSVVFCIGFRFTFRRFAPESVWKNSLDVRFVFLGSFSLP